MNESTSGEMLPEFINLSFLFCFQLPRQSRLFYPN